MSPSPLPLWRFPNKLLSLLPALQRLHPMWPAVPLFAPGGLVQVGAAAPLGLLTSWVLPNLTMPPSAYLGDSPYALRPLLRLPLASSGTLGSRS
jgi:hypothetical protein